MRKLAAVLVGGLSLCSPLVGHAESIPAIAQAAGTVRVEPGHRFMVQGIGVWTDSPEAACSTYAYSASNIQQVCSVNATEVSPQASPYDMLIGTCSVFLTNWGSCMASGNVYPR